MAQNIKVDLLFMNLLLEGEFATENTFFNAKVKISSALKTKIHIYFR